MGIISAHAEAGRSGKTAMGNLASPKQTIYQNLKSVIPMLELPIFYCIYNIKNT